MFDVFDFANRFNLRVDDTMFVLKERRQMADRDIAVFVDGRGQYGASILAEPFWIIGSAPEKRNPVWCLADDHGAPCFNEIGLSKIGLKKTQ